MRNSLLAVSALIFGWLTLTTSAQAADAAKESCQNTQEIVHTAAGLGMITVMLPGSKNCFADDVPDQIACNVPKASPSETCVNQAASGVKTESGVQIVTVRFYSAPSSTGCTISPTDLAQKVRKLTFDKAICYPKGSEQQMAGRISARR